jgi:ComF family protein
MLDYLLPRRCAFCRRPHPDGLCDSCREILPLRERPDAGGVIAPLYYRDMVRFALHRYKFRGISGYAGVFGALMAGAAHGVEADVVTWVPCGFGRRWTRGYDQSRLLAAIVARRLGLPAERLLSKTRPVKSQTKMKDDAARRRNVQGVFKTAGPSQGKRILLIDDIYTSGATMDEAQRVLLSAGATGVIPCVLATRR